METTVDNNTEDQAPEGQAPEGQQSATTQNQDVEQNDLGWTDDQKTYIKGLRDENAKYRTRAKEQGTEVNVLSERLSKFENGLKSIFGDDSDQMTPEETIEALQVQNEQLAVQTALKEAAFEYGIDKDSYEYFEFLVSKRLSELQEGEELSEEDLDQIAQAARGKTASANTSVGVNATSSPAPMVDDGGITLERFQDMTITEKSVLYQKNEQLYNQLAAQERSAKKKR